MEPEPEPGQITASVGRLCLRFKDATEANRAQAFVKCTIFGLGASLFSPSSTSEVDESAPAAPVSQAALAPVLEKSKAPSSWSIESKPVDIISPPVEEGAISYDSGTGDKTRNEQTSAQGGGAAAVEAAVVTAGDTVGDMGFSFQSKKFALNEENLSKLGATEIKMEVCMRGGGGADNSAAVGGVTVIGNATARVVDVLQGRNEWSHALALGGLMNPGEETAKHRTGGTTVTQDGRGRSEEGEGPDTGVRDKSSASVSDLQGGRATAVGNMLQLPESKDPEDMSAGLLQYGGSTSSLRVSLTTDDDTADYTVGGGLLWVSEAEVVGIPEGWKVQLPPGMEHTARNDAIAQLLAGPQRHEYSISWPGDHKTADTVAYPPAIPFPAMRITGGRLRYIPNEEVDSARLPTVQGSDVNSKDVAGSVGGSTLTYSNSGGCDRSAANADPLPPTGQWSVRFPSTQDRRVFLHRAGIRALRQALLADKGSDSIIDSGDKGVKSADGVNPKTTLPVFLERRQLFQVPPADTDQPSGGGKGGKKGGKKGADKGAAPNEQPALPPETPWRCKAVIDLSALVARQAVGDGGERGDGRRRKSSASESVSIVTSNGDSPLTADISARLFLDVPPAAGGCGMTVNTREGEGGVHTKTPEAPPATSAGDHIGDDGDTRSKVIAIEVETRTVQMEASDTRLRISFALTRPLLKGNMRQQGRVSVSDVFLPKNVGPRKPPRDVEQELMAEMDAFVLAVLAEYAKLFLQTGSEAPGEELTPEDREKRLFYALNSGGLYHSFVERLKQRVQRVVRKRFRTVPANPTEGDAFVAELYAHLVEQAAVVLNQRIKNIEAAATPSYIPTDEDICLQKRVNYLGILADDAEARGDHNEAAARHEDLIEAATGAAAARSDWRELLAHAWEDYARFLLRSRRQQQPQSSPETTGRSGEDFRDNRTPNNADRAARCLEESLGVYPLGSEGSLSATAVLAAVAIDQGQFDRASALLEKARETRLPALEEGADGYDTDLETSNIPRREHVLACLLRDLMGDSQGARRSLFLAVLASKKEGDAGAVGAIAADDEPRAPRRTTARVMHDACEWLLELGLPNIARRALAVAEESDRLAVKKAKERGLPTRTPTALREASRRLRCLLILAEGNAAEGSFGEVAETLALEAVELLPDDPRPWQALAEAYDAQGAFKASEAAGAWGAVLDRMEQTWKMSSDTGSSIVPPLRVYMRLGSLYDTLGRTGEAKACYLRACRVWRAPGPWLGFGSACLKLEQWEEAEEALQHASRLDCNSPLVWGHLALLLLSLGEDRLEEGDRALSQALRLGLADASLLRELGNCYVAAGRLEAAEGALRMSLAADVNTVGGNPHTRRRLADVLSARNATTQAVEEYRRVLESPSADESERQDVLTRCGNLLRKMGRVDELDQLHEVCRRGDGGEGKNPREVALSHG